VDNFVVNPPFGSTKSSGAFNNQTNFRAGKTALQKWATIKAQIAHDIVSRI